MCIYQTLLIQHFKLVILKSTEKSFCSINQWLDCDVVNTSAYATLFSVPVSGLALVFYVLLTIYFSVLLIQKKPRASGSTTQGIALASFCFFLCYCVCIRRIRKLVFCRCRIKLFVPGNSLVRYW